MIKILLLAVVPFMTQHRNVVPKTEVSTNFYGSVTGIVDNAYIQAHGGGGGGGTITDVQTNGVSVVTGTVANIIETDPTVPSWAKQENPPVTPSSKNEGFAQSADLADNAVEAEHAAQADNAVEAEKADFAYDIDPNAPGLSGFLKVEADPLSYHKQPRINIGTVTNEFGEVVENGIRVGDTRATMPNYRGTVIDPVHGLQITTDDDQSMMAYGVGVIDWYLGDDRVNPNRFFFPYGGGTFAMRNSASLDAMLDDAATPESRSVGHTDRKVMNLIAPQITNVVVEVRDTYHDETLGVTFKRVIDGGRDYLKVIGTDAENEE